ncbi:hypothetical protein GCM10028803_45260 [Larkinella knui]|uniref:Uncharacterized protein n=1 Tax=Larkinella knui TaxID=2025310 RepID=A0A3P1CP87_9BACT|nr:hypothetical protein [Larkinella knui]RRB15132.1 hypothetical protein EHT87_11315 [Larkinella knui]
MEPKKERWINAILNSAEGMQRAEPSPFLFAKIRDRLQTAAAPVYVSPVTVWLTVASFALLILLNWQVMEGPSNASVSQPADLTTVAKEMNLFPTGNQLY